MDIGKFITDYTKAMSQQVKDNMVKKHVVATYVPYEMKTAEARNIVENSAFKIVNGKRVFWMDTPMRYILFVKDLINLYTDLEWDQTNILLQFNLMEQYGIIDKITEAIGDDYNKFQVVLDMALNDTMTNERSLVSYFETMGQAAGTVFDELSNALMESNKE